MRTTLDLPEKTMAHLMRATRAKKKTKAVIEAIEFFVRAKKMASLKRLSGKLRIDANWRRLEELELKEAGHAVRAR